MLVNMETAETTQRTTTCRRPIRRVPPEGGWGFVVMIGLAISFILTLGALPCIALLFGDIIESLGPANSGHVSWVTGTYFMAFSLCGLFTNRLFRRFGMRRVGLAGAVALCVGGLLSVPAASMWHVAITFGGMQGAGFAVMMSVSYATFSRYFVRRRTFMMGLAQTWLGVGSMVLPLLVAAASAEYGAKGARLVVAALNGHAVVAMLVMQPVRWHMRKEWVRVEEEMGEEVEVEMMPVAKEEEEESKEQHEPMLMTSPETEPSIPDIWSRIAHFLDLHLLLDTVYLNICLGMSFALYSDITFFTVQPIYLRQALDYPPSTVANIIAIGAASDLLGRFFLALYGAWAPHVRARRIYLAGAVLTIAVRIGFHSITDVLGMCIVTGMLGFLRAWLHVPIALVLAEHLDVESFAAGNGLFMFVQGIIAFAVGPAVGALQNWSGGFAVTFHCLTGAMALCAGPWLLELMWSTRCGGGRRPERSQRQAVGGLNENTKAFCWQ